MDTEKISYKQTDKYKEYSKQYNKDYYNKNKPDTEPSYVKRKEKGLGEKTKEQYLNIIIRIHKKFSNKPIVDLRNVIDGVFTGDKLNTYHYKYIKSKMNYLNRSFIKRLSEVYENKTSLKVNLIPYTTLLSYLSEDIYFNKLHMIYQKFIINLNKDYETEKDDNKVSDDDKSKIITDFSEETLLANIGKISGAFAKMLYGLYTLIPPRRLEYREVYLTTNKKIDKDKNYLLIHKKKPTAFIFQDYKTSKTYGAVKVDIPEPLQIIISNYITEYKKKSGNLFIDMNVSSYIKIIKKTFKDIYDADISVRWIRISYATYIDKLNISNNDKRDIAIKMGHNLAMSSKYKKII